MSRLAAAAKAARARHLAAFEAPAEAEAATLRAALAALGGSRFAADHGLAPDMDLRAFRAAVPVRGYEDFAPWLGRLEAGEGRALTSEPPLAVELTGGSSGGRKPVPLSPALLGSFQTGLMGWLGDLFARWPDLPQGRAYFALSPALTRRPPPFGRWPIGLQSDLAYFGGHGPAMAPWLAHAPGLAALDDLTEWRSATLALLLGCDDLSFISIWSPSFLSALLDTLATDPTPALAALAQGTCGLASNPARARALERLPALAPAQIWPRLRLVSAWADASSAAPFAALAARLGPEITCQGKGLLATEGLFTLPFAQFADPVPACLSSLLEFAPEPGLSLSARELTPGESYDLIVSPVGGFARYALGDRVTCTGWARPGLPMLRFAGRGAAASDMVGEKLTEAFVLDCLAQAGCAGTLIAKAGAAPHYWLATSAPLPEAALTELEAALARNPHYAHARRLGQLGPLTAQPCPDLTSRLIAARLAQGHRLSDIKPAVLLSAERFSALMAP